MTNIELNNGYAFPIVGLGTLQSQPNEVKEAVKYAIDVGYRHIDCAFFYQNEDAIGEAIRNKIQDGIVKREDLFITSKLWNTFHKHESILPAIKKSLENLGLDYLDLYLMHWPFAWKESDELNPKDVNGVIQTIDTDYIETWRAMESLVELGLSRSIGVSNFNSQQVARILSICKIKPVVNQVECNPNINQKKLIAFCKECNIVVTGFCPLGQISSIGKPGLPNPTIMDPNVIDMSRKYKKTAAQVVLNYLTRYLGIAVIPKSVNKKRIEENFDIFDFELENRDIKYLDSLNCGKRVCVFAAMKKHKYYPFHLEY